MSILRIEIKVDGKVRDVFEFDTSRYKEPELACHLFINKVLSPTIKEALKDNKEQS